ncbi:MAG TPA: hypothetical protein VMH83_11225 [Candidatus Acidoferrum sp.]|nr:hypothetical protein [Candidatus Acidoferrum sp.]
MTASPAKSLQLVSSRIVAGYLPGWQLPVAVFELSIGKDFHVGPRLVNVHNVLHATAPGLALALPPAAPTAEQTGQYLLDCLQALMTQARFEQLAPPRFTCTPMEDGAHLQLTVPTFSRFHTAVNIAFDACLHLMSDAWHDAGRQRASHALKVLEFQRPPPGIPARLLRAALESGIPWLYTTQSVFQFGWGRRSCLFDATYTEHTGNIGARIASSKPATAQVLRLAGIPVPAHEIVTSVLQAETATARLGFPVVVKPADLGGGAGVTTCIVKPDAVAAAFHRARTLSATVLVERHIAGRDFRVIVLNGKVIEVSERVPASVTGDGQRDIKALLAEFNSDPRRQPSADRLKQVMLDTEVLSLLAEQQLQPDSVPAAGRSVRLRQLANIWCGGSALPVPLSAVHPDNLLLCERAAGALRLDLCGIDLLSPDLGISWRDNRAAICEVNSQPNMPPALAGRILRQVIEGQGRIPVAAVLMPAGQAATTWRQNLQAALCKREIVAGIADADGIHLQDAAIHPAASAADAAGLLLREPTLAAALFVISDVGQLRDGAPTDKLDLLVVATTAPDPDALRQLHPRSAALWCVAGSKPALKRAALDGDVKPRMLSAARLDAALLNFLATPP